MCALALSGVAVLAASFVALFIAPRFREILTDFNAELPSLTQFYFNYPWFPLCLALPAIALGVLGAAIRRLWVLLAACFLAIAALIVTGLWLIALCQPLVNLTESLRRGG